MVDDDPDCRLLIRDIIAAAAPRADVHEAAGGAEALEYLRRSGAFPDAPRPDLVYMDVEMPGLSGREVLKQIVADPDLRDIPVVMLTGLDDERERQAADDAGAAGYVVKPAEPMRFLSVVSQSVNHWVSRRRAPHGAAPRPEDPTDD